MSHQRVKRLLGQAIVHPHRNAHHELHKLVREDREAFDAAKSEHQRLTTLAASVGCPLEKRCWASAQELKLLSTALAGATAPEQSDAT